jgi:L-histidine Nalpha-methyltransferase
MKSVEANHYGRDFAKDIRKGLGAAQKYIPSRYFYDKTGDKIFQDIMDLEEYYLTRCELEIITDNKEKLSRLFGEEKFRLIEFGAGNGLKTKVLINHLHASQVPFIYEPVDISYGVLDNLCSRIRKAFPRIEIRPANTDYFKALSGLDSTAGLKKVILFLGSSIGNLNRQECQNFLLRLGKRMRRGDLLVLGLDLKKDPGIILSAYNDKKGVTRQFNLNLLERLNKELGACFSTDKFVHYPVYDPIEGEARSFLLSTEKQNIPIRAIGYTAEFREWESIHTEISRKFDMASVGQMADIAGFRVTENFFDRKMYFVDSVWELK